jgi:histidinol-phosphate aminotransferase
LSPRAGAFVRPPHLRGLDRYEPGLPIEQVQALSGLSSVVKLASNENPFGPSPRALEALQRALPRLHRYPDGPASALRRALGERYGFGEAQVAIGNGSTDLIDLLARAFLGPGDDAVISEQAFARFGQVVHARNGGARLVPMRGAVHDLEAMAAAVGPNTRLVYVANPNNPTGTWNGKRAVKALVDALPEGVLLVLDEAYFEYADDPDYPNGLDYIRAGASVIVLRTFSKVYGLAGLRVGYGIAAPEVIESLDSVREPFNSNSLGQAAALAALLDHEHVERAVASNRVEKGRLAAELLRRGLESLPSLANFLCVDLGREAAPVFRSLLQRGVIVRPLTAYALPNALRVSVGTAAENDVFLAALDASL